MRVFLTGGTGLIGRALLSRLIENGMEVHLLVRGESPLAGLAHPRVSIFRGGLADVALLRQGMRGCDWVFHLAAQVGVSPAASDLFDRTNVEGTRNVLHAAQWEGIKRVIYTSTVMVMGPTRGLPADEKTSRIAPYFTEYERSKALAEAEVSGAVARGLPGVIVSPAFVYGPTEVLKRHSLNRVLYEAFRREIMVLPGDGGMRINAVYVEDVAAGHLLAAEHGKIGERYILGGENITLEQLFRQVATISGKRLALLHCPLWGLRIGCAIEQVMARVQKRAPKLLPKYVGVLEQDWIYSSDKAIAQLGYAPRPLSEGLHRTLAWLREGRFVL